MARIVKEPTLEHWEEAIIDRDNCVKVPGITLQIRRKESMSGQHVIVVMGGKRAVKKIYHDLHTGSLGEYSSRLPFKILDRLGAGNIETVAR